MHYLCHDAKLSHCFLLIQPKVSCDTAIPRCRRRVDEIRAGLLTVTSQFASSEVSPSQTT
ncbi:hypothetical protein BRADI_5g04695v3 [Brachypodium distachyon]|uniref:Uncharacterized protein n=1 Tax=Brachypodium distachyon TaxID=15368 RepID=A0A2K2CFH6_BRADI|nr:hypothetical protein BRADI_5g04695v3 [Brachypodium distachyon]